MDWMEVKLRGARDASEAMCALMYEAGASGVEIDDPLDINRYIDSGAWDYTDLKKSEDVSTVAVTAYFSADESFEKKFEGIVKGFNELQSEFPGKYFEPERKKVADEDWENSWKDYFHTEKIGEKIVISPPWEEYKAKSGEVTVKIDPGAAFGTGQHPTTALAIRALEKYVNENDRVFDVGTGSGVLAIAAAKLGANDVVAMDYDSVAVRIAGENVALNAVEDKITLGVSDCFQNFEGRADVIVANIIADIVLKLLPEVAKRLNEKGRFIAGGIIDERLDDVLKGAELAKLRIIEECHDKGWALLVMEKSI